MVRKTAGIGARKTASKPSTGGKTGLKVPVAKTRKAKFGASGKVVIKTAARKKAALRILSPSKGARTLTHRKIEQAVQKVFEERYGTDD